jgi:hypothetical protein
MFSGRKGGRRGRVLRASRVWLDDLFSYRERWIGRFRRLRFVSVDDPWEDCCVF